MDNHTNRCINGCNSLIKADYAQKQLRVRNLPGMFKYQDWLFVSGFRDVKTAPVTYQSKALSKELGLSGLYISFNGYRPEINAKLRVLLQKAAQKTCLLHLRR
ncbi:MAG: hypothetical protein PHV39_05190 [Methanomicrobium sp.]|nr:hypothetical protein [Methanomicrobium sp.]